VEERGREGRKRGRRRVKGRERGVREEKKRGRRSGGSCGLHFFKETVAQDFWSDFFASNSFFGSHWAQRKTALNKFEF
jgi:hypothetical protein